MLIFLLAIVAVFLLLLALAMSLCKAAANDYGPAAERDSREGLDDIKADFARLQDTINRF